MAGSAPELVIPVRLDPSGVASGLTKVEGALSKVETAGRHTGKELKQGFDDAKGGAAGLTDQVGDLLKAQMSFGAAKQALAAISGEFKRAADYTQNLVNNFVALQKTMQSVAAISGKPNTNEFTLDVAQKAAAANQTPAQFTAFQDAFLSKASNYVGDKPGAKLSEADSLAYQQAMSEYAALHGVAPSEMADFAGGLLAQEQGPTTAEAMKAKAGKVFATLEASSKKVSGLLPGMTRIMAQGFSASEAAPVLSMMPEIAPDEESTHLLRVIGEVRKLNMEGKGEEYGIKKGMTSAQQLEALVGNLSDRSSKGEDLDKLIQGVTKEDIAGNTLRGLVRQGPRGFKQWKDILAKTADNAVDVDIAAGRESSAGKIMRGESQVALAEAERGAVHAAIAPERLDARADFIRSGKQEQYNLAESMGRGLVGYGTGVSGEGQQINQRMLASTRARALAAGVEDQQLEFSSRQGNDALLMQQVEVDKEVVRLLGLINDKIGNPGPMLAPAPTPNLRMGG